MVKREKFGWFILGTVLGILVLCLCLGITASAMARMEREERQKAYLENKAIFVGEVREYLAGQGYQNCGIMLTRMVCKDGTEEYKLSVHHGRISALGEEEKARLMEELRGFPFSGDEERVLQILLW